MLELSKEIPKRPKTALYDYSLFFFEFPNSDYNGYTWSYSWSEAISDHGSCDMLRVTMLK